MASAEPARRGSKAAKAAGDSAYGARREQIIEAALKLFNDAGVGPVSTNHIATEAGISPGNLYYHFRNKVEIVGALLERFNADLSTHLGTNLPQEPKASLARLYDGGADLLWRYRFVLEDRAVITRLDGRFMDAARTLQGRFVKMVAGLLELGAARGWVSAGLDDDDRRIVAGNLFIVAGGALNFARNAARRKHATRADVEAGLRQVFHFLLPYLEPPTRALVRAYVNRGRTIAPTPSRK